MTRRHWLALTLGGAGGALLYLRDPSWVGGISSGLRPWEEDPPGTRFRWTAGRAAFFVPARAAAITVPLRSVFAGPVDVEILADDRWLTTVRLVDPAAWVQTTLPMGGRQTRRRYRRIDLRVSRVVPPFMLGVMVGEVRIADAIGPRAQARFESASESAGAGRPVSGWDTPARRPTENP